MGWFTYKREHAEPLPIMVMAIENYGRVYRLLKANVPVTIEMDVETEFTGDHEHGFDTIAEIPGTDPKAERRSGDGWRASGFVGVRDRSDRQRCGDGRCDGSDAHSECAASAAATHHPRRTVDRRRARRVWIVRIREAAFRISCRSRPLPTR